MVLGVITGSGTDALPGFEDPTPRFVDTRWGDALVVHGTLAGVEVRHVSRHGDGHTRLSSNINHRANVAALKETGAQAVIGLTACGAVDRDVPLGSLIVFDDLHFPVNRLPSGELCTFYREGGDPARGHWIFEAPFSEPVRAQLLAAAQEAGHAARDGGTYGHVDGPRFNTRAEIAQLAAAGVAAVSQTGGPEAVLCGEIELPYALMGFVTDYANGVADAATPVEDLIRLMGESTAIFGAVLDGALPLVAGAAPGPVGTVYRFEPNAP